MYNVCIWTPIFAAPHGILLDPKAVIKTGWWLMEFILKALVEGVHRAWLRYARTVEALESVTPRSHCGVYPGCRGARVGRLELQVIVLSERPCTTLWRQNNLAVNRENTRVSELLLKIQCAAGVWEEENPGSRRATLSLCRALLKTHKHKTTKNSHTKSPNHENFDQSSYWFFIFSHPYWWVMSYFAFQSLSGSDESTADERRGRIDRTPTMLSTQRLFQGNRNMKLRVILEIK